jgi:hypothetical protein
MKYGDLGLRAENLLPGTPRMTIAAAVMTPADLRRELRAMFGDDVHSKTLTTVQNAVEAVLAKATLALSVMAAALAAAQGLLLKNAERRLADLLANARFDPWAWGATWVPYVVAARTEILVALDWTDFDADGQATIYATLLTNHGRATPLLWRTVPKPLLADGGRNDEEDALLLRLREVLPAGVAVTLVADRGFADQKLFHLLQTWGWSYVIRVRKNVTVTNAAGESRDAGSWGRPDGRAVRLVGATITTDRFALGNFVAVHAPRMKEAWLLACSADIFSSAMGIQIYGKRFSCEETFRDQQDPRFGLGMDHVRCDAPAKRDRLIMLAAIVQALLTLLGAAGEVSGVDKTLSRKKNKRVFSLFRQGKLYFELLPTMPEPYRTRLIEAFGTLIQQHPAFADPLGYL